MLWSSGLHRRSVNGWVKLQLKTSVLVLSVATALASCHEPSGTPLTPVRTAVSGVLRPAPAGGESGGSGGSRARRFFSPDGNRVILLSGSHTWNTFQDIGFTSPPAAFDYGGFLDSLVGWNHNFLRLYSWEQASFSAGTPRRLWFTPVAYQRTGPGLALDSLPKFDLSKLADGYFTRLREHVVAARRRGIYVSVMLFNGWSLGDKGLHIGNPWTGHPFNRANNINGIDGDRDHDGEGNELHTLGDSSVLAIQERYVRRVIATLQDLDNVLYEISNESAPGSAEWQYHMIRLIHDAERALPYHHPVGMTVEYPNGTNAVLTASPADWFSPNGHLEEPVPFPGRQVVIWDTDHLCGMCASIGWVWKAVLSGYNPILMDGWDGRATVVGWAPYERSDPKWELARRNLGYAVTLTNRIGLGRLSPQGGLASSGYCLADTSAATPAFLVYVPRSGWPWRAGVDVDLRRLPASDTLDAAWLNLRDGTEHAGGTVTGGQRAHLASPVRAETVLILERR